LTECAIKRDAGLNISVKLSEGVYDVIGQSRLVITSQPQFWQVMHS